MSCFRWRSRFRGPWSNGPRQYGWPRATAHWNRHITNVRPEVDSISSAFFNSEPSLLLNQRNLHTTSFNCCSLTLAPKTHILHFSHTKELAFKPGQHASASPSNAYGSPINAFPWSTVGGKSMAGFGLPNGWLQAGYIKYLKIMPTYSNPLWIACRTYFRPIIGLGSVFWMTLHSFYPMRDRIASAKEGKAGGPGWNSTRNVVNGKLHKAKPSHILPCQIIHHRDGGLPIHKNNCWHCQLLSQDCEQIAK